jgi:hypothetical protein
MSAGHDQPDARVNLPIGERQLAGVEMPFEVIDGNKRYVEGEGKRLRHGETDDERPDQAGSDSDRHGTDPRQGHVGLAQRFVDDGQDLPDVSARRDLGDDSSEPLMQVDL